MARFTSLLTAAVIAATSTVAFSGAAQANSEGAIPAATAKLQVSADCYTSGGKLYCGNYANAAIYEHRRFDSPIVDFVRTTFSVFSCWGHGEAHSGGNDIWYWTNGDYNGRWGNMPASEVFTSEDPPAGMTQC
jgi:hypothetical protein